MDSNSHRMEWKIKQDIAKTIMSIGGIVFGGFVRDSILHDYWAKRYYKLAEEECFLEEETIEKYTDREIFPETINRLALPKDIDCYLSSMTDVAMLENKLTEKKYTHDRVFVRENAKEYLPRLDVPDDTVVHIRYKICCINSYTKYKLKVLIANALPREFYAHMKSSVVDFLNNLQELSTEISYIYMDVLVNKSSEHILHPPFGNIDFECNSLIMSDKGIYVSPHLQGNYGQLKQTTDLFKLEEITQDIIRKRAVMVRSTKPIDTFRVSKMRLRGWNVVAPMKFIVSIDPESSENTETKEKEICIICHDPIQQELHYKIRCCAAKYHKECLLNCIHKGPSAMGTTSKCIMCKRYVPYILEEGNMLQVL